MTGRAAVTAPHEAAPADLTAYTTQGPNTGRAANLANPWHFPAEALCFCCGGVIRTARHGEPWAHTGRMPGDPR